MVRAAAVPWLDELTTLAIMFPNFHVDTSAYALSRLPPAFGPHRDSSAGRRSRGDDEVRARLAGARYNGGEWPLYLGRAGRAATEDSA